MLETKTEEIILTPSAQNAVRDLIQKRQLAGYALRVFVSGGGCSGMQYGMSLENNIRESDLTWMFGDVQLVIDEISIDYLRGASIDYIEDVMESGFKIDNPNAISSCGCGSSFRTQNSASGSGGGCGSGGCH